MGLKERLLDYIAYKGIDKATLERNSGLSNDAVNKMGDNTRTKTLDKISNAYPDINIAWLKTGIGEMLISEERKEKIISVDQTAISETKRKGALIYDIDATCGIDGRDIEFTDERVIGSIEAPEINSNSKIIFATGDSMVPLITSGDRIVVRKIESWDYFNYGQVYLIITNDYRFIKRVRKHPVNPEDLILLRSENADYDDIDLPKREIVHLFIVENILSIKNIL